MKKPQKPAKTKARKRRTKKPADRPRTFEEVRAANLADPYHAARIARLESGDRFDDATANSNDQWERRSVSIHAITSTRSRPDG